jgi:hypothetical protein
VLSCHFFAANYSDKPRIAPAGEANLPPAKAIQEIPLKKGPVSTGLSFENHLPGSLQTVGLKAVNIDSRRQVVRLEGHPVSAGLEVFIH